MEQIEIIGVKDGEGRSFDFYFPVYFEFNVNTKDISKITKLYIEVDGEVHNKISIDEFNGFGIIKGELSLRIQYLNNEDKLFIQDENREFFEEISLAIGNNPINYNRDFFVNLEVQCIYIEKIIDDKIFVSCCIRGDFE